jgi:hypothetical protein
MNVTHKKSLALMVAATLGVMSPMSLAVIKLDPAETSGKDPVKFYAEEATESALVIETMYQTADATFWMGDLTVHFPVIGGYEITDANPVRELYIRLQLTNGATFANKPLLLCGQQGADSNDMSTEDFADLELAKIANIVDGDVHDADMSGVLVEPTLGGQNSATATFSFDAGTFGADTKRFTTRASGCIVVYSAQVAGGTDVFASTVIAQNQGITAISVAARQDISMRVEVNYKEAARLTTSTYSGVIIKFVTGLSFSVTAKASNNSVTNATIDVQQASKGFVSQAGTNSKTKVNVGSIKMAALSPNIRLATLSAADAFPSVILSSADISISGGLIAGAKTVSLAQNADCGGTQISSVTMAATTTTPGTGTTPSAPTALLGINAAGLYNATPANAALNNGLNVCIEANGTSTLDEGTISAIATTVTPTDKTKYAVDFGAGGEMVTVTRNGVVVRVLNIPNTTATADKAFIRIYNTSESDLEVRGTLYGQDGKAIGTANALLISPTLKAKAVVALPIDALIKAVGKDKADWAGRAWLQIQAPVDKQLFKVQSLVRSPNGTLVNVSTDATD